MSLSDGSLAFVDLLNGSDLVKQTLRNRGLVQMTTGREVLRKSSLTVLLNVD
jgi:hypothetical protein